jgi:hypothetical protein
MVAKRDPTLEMSSALGGLGATDKMLNPPLPPVVLLRRSAGRISEVSWRATARVPSCHFLPVGVKSGSICEYSVVKGYVVKERKENE